MWTSELLVVAFVAHTATSSRWSPLKSPTAMASGKKLAAAILSEIGVWNVPSPLPNITLRLEALSMLTTSSLPSPLKSPVATATVEKVGFVAETNVVGAGKVIVFCFARGGGGEKKSGQMEGGGAAADGE